MDTSSFVSAIGDFHRARRRAALHDLLARLTGRPSELLAYEEVRSKLKIMGEVSRGLQQIELDRIVGSVGRYRDFNREFLPREESDEQRWAGVKAAVASPSGLPPIEVYQIGEVYFVKDGNHRVSVARELGVKTTEAYVTEVRTRVPLTAGDSPDDLILKAEQANFLLQTRLDETRPEIDLRLTAPGGFETLLEHIRVHRYYMGAEEDHDVSFEEAAAHWLDTVYRPVAELIREGGVLRGFPGRTEADLYLWLSEHRASLEDMLGWEVTSETAAEDLQERFGMGLGTSARPPALLKNDEPTGGWRKVRHRNDTLCDDILVAINGAPSGWVALTAAVGVARREGALLHGLHIVPFEAQRAGEAAQAVQEEFERRCEAAGVRGRLALAVGSVSREVVARSRWTDLVVLSLNYPPPKGMFARPSSGLHTILHRSNRPVLLVCEEVSHLERVLVAFDGSPKAREALYVGTYLAEKWGAALCVVSVHEGRGSQVLEEAMRYTEGHGVNAQFSSERGDAAEAILRTAERQESGLIIMGVHRRWGMLEVALGSTVDAVLRAERCSVLVCS